ncbi:MAG: site-specific integrase [Actinomycetota bacterium]|nr:site-specific integrase [Actinomycetota bacterium]
MAAVSGHVKLVEGKRGPVWFIKYRFPSGKQKQDRLGPAWTERSRPPAGYFTKRLAEAELQTALTDIRRGEVLDPGHSTGKTLGDATAEFLRYVETEKALKASTLRDYRSGANSTLLPEFGSDTPLEDLTEDRMAAFRARLLTDGKLARRTVQKHIVLLNGIFKRAKACKWIPQNPMDEVEPVNIARSGEFNVLTASQVEAVARKAVPAFAAAIIVAAYTGLRAGELRALRWRDVSFERATIHVPTQHARRG